jgi:hypothetical protein
VTMPLSGALWLAVAAGIMTVVAIVWIVRTKSNAHSLDVGSVSTQWITEHRVGSDTSISR